MVSSPFYDNQHWEFHLPVNPPLDGGGFPERLDSNHIDPFTGEPYVYPGTIDRCDLDNWNFGSIGRPDYGYRSRVGWEELEDV